MKTGGTKKKQIPWLSGVIFLTIIILSACQIHKKPSDNEKPGKMCLPAIHPPVPNLAGIYTTITVNPGNDTVITGEKGFSMMIPSGAFLDENKQIIAQPVEIRSREFLHAPDIYLAGIPMQYDSAGNSLVFETAGMIEIWANADNKPVFINPAKKIKITIPAFDNSKRFSIYYLDTVSQKWLYAGKDSIAVQNYAERLSGLPEVPPEPVKAGDYSFKVADYSGKYPELAIYKNVLFEPVDGKPCGFTCTDIKIKALHHGRYEITFTMDAYGYHNEQKCICYLAFREGAEYNEALTVYRLKYKSLIANRKKIKQQRENEWNRYFEIRKKYADAGMLDFFYKEQIKKLTAEKRILRTLELNQFGFINLDAPCNYPQGAELLARFADQTGKTLLLSHVVLIEKGRNALFRYSDRIKFNPSKENLLWGITPEGKPAVFKAVDFKKIQQTQGEYTFLMTLPKTDIKTYDDIMNFLLKD